MKTLELRRVSRLYGSTPALDDVSLLLQPGTNLALVGRSGSGKSTALRLLAGLEAPESGEVLVDSRPASVARRVLIPPCDRGVAMVFQDLGLWPALSAMENVRLGLASQGGASTTQLAREALRLCRLSDGAAARFPSELSGGEQQRVALARAIARKPRFLFLDEPFTGLDFLTREQLLLDIRRIARRADTTIVLVTHDPVEAAVLCTTGAVLESGRLVAHGSWAELMSRPANDLMRALRGPLDLALQAAAGRDGEPNDTVG